MLVDGTQSKVVDFDVPEILREFRANAASRHSAVDIHGLTFASTAQ